MPCFQLILVCREALDNCINMLTTDVPDSVNRKAPEATEAESNTQTRKQTSYAHAIAIARAVKRHSTRPQLQDYHDGERSRCEKEYMLVVANSFRVHIIQPANPVFTVHSRSSKM